MKTSREVNENHTELKFCEACLNIIYVYENHTCTYVKLIAAIF